MRVAASRARPLLLLALACCGCDHLGHRTLTPKANAGFTTSGAGVRASVEQIHLEWRRGGSSMVDVRVENGTGRDMYFDTGKVELIELPGGPTTSLGERSKQSPIDLGSPASAVVAGAQAGSQLGGGGSGGAAGALVGGGLGFVVALAAIVLVSIPIGIYMLVDAAVAEAKRSLNPGESSTLLVDLGGTSLSSGKRYALVLDNAAGLPRGSIPPLVLVRPDELHYGYGPPERREVAYSMRMGGGVVRQGTASGGLGGVEIFYGPQIGDLSFGPFFMLGSGALGAEVRYDIELTDWMTIVPFAGYGYYWLAGWFGLNAGHGGRAGLEVLFPTGPVMRMDWLEDTVRIGLYGHGGPAFITGREGVGYAMQFGLAVGFF